MTFDWPRMDTDRKHSGLEVEVDDLKEKYSDPKTSQWKVTITDGENTLGPYKLD